MRHSLTGKVLLSTLKCLLPAVTSMHFICTKVPEHLHEPLHGTETHVISLTLSHNLKKEITVLCIYFVLWE